MATSVEGEKPVTSTDEIDSILQRSKELLDEKTVWNTHWQLVSEYVMTRKSDFTEEFTSGEFLNKDLFDSTAVHSNRTMASSLLGMLWPNGSESFKLDPPKDLNKTKINREYYNKITEIMADVMDDPKAGSVTALE